MGWALIRKTREMEEKASVTWEIVKQCAQCRADIIAAEWSEHLSDYCVRNVWSCEACGYRFEDTVYLSWELADAQ
jgi:C4-type Zn-finger protein